MNLAARMAGKFLQPIQIKPIILIRYEADLPVISSLNQVQGYMG